MAPGFPRRRRDRPASGPASAPGDDDDVHLDDDEHAWWAQRDIESAWSPPDEPPRAEDPAPERDVLAEHFGDDWRTSFGFDAARGDAAEDEAADVPDEEPRPSTGAAAASDPGAPADPYAVLEVAASASWEEIVEAHRRMARRHHPDLLVGRTDTEIAAGENRIRDINVAYQELRVRRGR